MGNQHRAGSAYAVADALAETGYPLGVDHQWRDLAWYVRFAEFLRSDLEPEMIYSS